MTHPRLEETDGRTQYASPPLHRIIEGEVYEHILRGEEELVREYCKLDVVSTLLAFLSWVVQRGDLEVPRLTELVAVIREALSGKTFSGWREIADGLENWPQT